LKKFFDEMMKQG